jgi:cyclic beta-1,2-glucan synthetase
MPNWCWHPPAADLAHPAFSKLFVVTDLPARTGRHHRHPPPPLALPTPRSGPPISPWSRAGDRPDPDRDRPRPVHRAGRSIATAAWRMRRCRGPPAPCWTRSSAIRRRVRSRRGAGARDVLDHVADDARHAARPGGPPPRPVGLRAGGHLSWTQAQVQLRHLGMTPADAADFQRLGGMLMRHDARLRAPCPDRCGRGPQSALWALGISGDLPIMLFRIDRRRRHRPPARGAGRA